MNLPTFLPELSIFVVGFASGMLTGAGLMLAVAMRAVKRIEEERGYDR